MTPSSNETVEPLGGLRGFSSEITLRPDDVVVHRRVTWHHYRATNRADPDLWIRVS